MSAESRVTRYTLQSGATATGNGSTMSPQGVRVTFQVVGITTATVTIEASLDGGTTWTTTGTSFTADGINTITGYFPLVRAKISAYTSGTISVYAVG